MKILGKLGSLQTIATSLLAVPVLAHELEKKQKPSSKSAGAVTLADLDAAASGKISSALKQAKFKPVGGSTMNFSSLAGSGVETALVVGWDDTHCEAFEEHARYRKLGSTLGAFARGRRIEEVTLSCSHLDLRSEENLAALLEGFLLSAYVFNGYKSKKDDAPAQLHSITLLGMKKVPQKVVDLTLATCAATMFARDLVNTPPHDCTPRFIADHCRKIAKAQKLKIDVFDDKALRKMGAGGLLGVAQGSDEPPYLIRMIYRPKNKAKKVISLVGKGVTFDSGGLSIKTGAGMETMKCDMSGAAAVAALMSMISILKPNFEVRGYIPMSGKTIEVLNTDAEGRLILADALTLAEKDGSDVIVDLATLTGACMVALGSEYAGLFSNDDKLVEQLIAAGDKAGEHLWRMPLVKEYKDWIKSPVADIKNTGKTWGGAITAALFLEEFISKAKWAHLDIAGTAFADSDNGHIRRGGVGFGVRTLVNFLRAQ
jgi:leucyl aminopeptidase